MGACKSKPLKEDKSDCVVGHEKLEEDNDAYFERVESRNKVRFSDSPPKRPKSGDRNISSSTDGASVTSTSQQSMNTLRNRAAMLKSAEDEAILRQTAGKGGMGSPLAILPSMSSTSFANSVLSPSNVSVVSARSKISAISVGSNLSLSNSSPLRPLPAPVHDTKSVNGTNSVYSAKSKASVYSMASSAASSAKTPAINTAYKPGAVNIPRTILANNDYITHYIYDEDNDTTEASQRQQHLDTLSLSSQQYSQSAATATACAWSEGLIYTEITRKSKITALAWDTTPGSSALAIGSDDGSVVMVHVEHHAAGQMANSSVVGSPSRKFMGAVRHLPPREGKIRSLSFSPIHHHLAIGGEDCTVVVMDLGSSDYDASSSSSSYRDPEVEIIGEIEREDRIHAVEYSPSGQFIAVAGFDGMCAIVNALTMDILTEISRSGLILSVAWQPSGSMIAIGGSDKEAAVVETDNWDVLGEIQRHGSIQCLRWSPYQCTPQRNGTEHSVANSTTSCSISEVSSQSREKEGMLAVGGSDGKVAIIDMDTKTVAKEISLIQLQNQQDELQQQHSRRKKKRNIPQDSPLISNDAKACRVNDVCWSPDGSYISICGSNGMAIIVETKTFAVVQEVNRANNLTCIAWQPVHGKYLAVGGDDHNVAVLKTGGMVTEHVQPNGKINNELMSSHSGSMRSPSGWVMSEDFDDVEGNRDLELRSNGGSVSST